MFIRTKHGVLLLTLLFLLACAATAQVMSIPSSGFGDIGAGGNLGGPVSIGALSSEQMTNNLWYLTGHGSQSPLNTPGGSVSALDLKAPAKAQREFAKGYQFLMRKDYPDTIQHLAAAISIYPSFVAAHNALGSAYLQQGRNLEARDEFAKAVALDDHLPTSFFNLGCAQLALKDFHSAEDSVQKASALAPVDIQLATALTYAQFMNQDYGAVLATAHQVHSRKHEGAAMVHYFAAAAAWDGLNQPQQARTELQTFLREDPKSPQADQARNILAQIKVDEIRRESRKKQLASPPPPVPAAAGPTSTGPTPEQIAAQRQWELQDAREQKQIAEAEAEPEPVCATCNSAPSPAGTTAAGLNLPSIETSIHNGSVFTLHKVVDEVAVFFAATDHGKSVTDLTPQDVGVRDDQQSPAVVTGFRTQAQLPLRLGVVIDTSESIADRFSFEQRAATDFLQKVLTNKDDLAFVVGAANSILLVQDFTSDQPQMSHAVSQLAPGGGTALWDAVAFAAEKLAARQEAQPVARMLVVISDGQDNSSSSTLKEAIATATRGEVFVYTVSTRENTDNVDDLTVGASHSLVGDHALKVLAENTGGAAFVPGSVHWLNKSLDDLQEVIRSRYLISYKPALFKRDGHYRTIDISAQKSGRKLRVYARKGYYASVTAPDETQPSRE